MGINDYKEITVKLNEMEVPAKLKADSKPTTDKKGAYLVAFSDDDERWIPKSQCEWRKPDYLEVADWLAQKIIDGDDEDKHYEQD